MEIGKDYVYYEDGLIMNSAQPTTRAHACVVGTNDYIFLIPKKTVGQFVILNTIKTHTYFSGTTVQKGLRRVIDDSGDQRELESSLIELLEYDEKFVHKIAEKKTFNFRGIFGKHTLRMSLGKRGWTSVMVNGKGQSKLFRAYYGQ